MRVDILIVEFGPAMRVLLGDLLLHVGALPGALGVESVREPLHV